MLDSGQEVSGLTLYSGQVVWRLTLDSGQAGVSDSSADSGAS